MRRRQLLVLFVLGICTSCSGWNFSGKTSSQFPTVKTVDCGNFTQMPAVTGYLVGDRDHPPEMTVSLGSFQISKYEVTKALYSAVLQGTAPTGADLDSLFSKGPPAVDMSWKEAVRFCNLLSAHLGYEPCYDEQTYQCDRSKNGFRLPTSAEWEYACRGHCVSLFFWGDDSAEVGNFTIQQENTGQQRTTPMDVGTKSPNQQLLYDMTGNVSEWCDDKFPEKDDWRVYRGGSFADEISAFESKWFTGCPEDEHYGLIGFRVVRTVRE